MSLACGAMLVRLEEIRKDIGKVQDGKLVDLWEEKGDYRDAPLWVIRNKLIEECHELIEALECSGPSEIVDEIIDVRNVTEFLWDVLKLSRNCAEVRKQHCDESCEYCNPEQMLCYKVDPPRHFQEPYQLCIDETVESQQKRIK